MLRETEINSLYFQEMELSYIFYIIKYLIFSQKKAFLILQETETPKKILYISGNKTS